MKDSLFQFNEPENTACFVCSHVLDGKRPILYVSHDDDDGSWQFLCGGDDHTEEDARIIGLKQATELDPSVNALYEMPTGYCAERNNADGDWQANKL